MSNYYAIRAYLLVDVSGSIKNNSDKIDAGVRMMINNLRQSDILVGTDIYLTVMAFNHRQHEVKVGEKNFRDLLINDSFDVNQMEEIKCKGGATDIGTPLYGIVRNAVEQYRTDRRSVTKFYHPIVALFTDGCPNAGLLNGVPEQEKVEQSFRLAADLIKEKENMRMLHFVAFYYGDNDADYQKLLTLSNYENHIMRYDNNDQMERFFFGNSC